MSGMSNSETLTILIERQPDGKYAAIDEANHDLGWPVGYGKTKLKNAQDPTDAINRRVQVVNMDTKTALK